MVIISSAHYSEQLPVVEGYLDLDKGYCCRIATQRFGRVIHISLKEILVVAEPLNNRADR